MNWRTAKLLCVDTETTGVDDDARIVELGAFICDSPDLGGGTRFGTLINPGITIPPEAIAIHGITDDDVVNAPTIEEARERFLNRVRQADVLVGYNFPFDSAMLERALGESWREVVEGKPVLDALALVRHDDVGRYWKGKGRHKLDNVAGRLGINRRGKSHRASSDAELAMCILFELGGVLPEDAFAAAEILRKVHEADRARFEAWKEANPLPEDAA